MGFEPTTLTLARLCSTPELHPRSVVSDLPWQSGDARLYAQSPVRLQPTIWPTRHLSVVLWIEGLVTSPFAGARRAQNFQFSPSCKGLVCHVHPVQRRCRRPPICCSRWCSDQG